MKDECLNIPRATVESFVNSLGALYCSAISKGMRMKSIPSAFLWGPPGIGKSQGVYELSREIEKRCSVTVNVTDVRLLLFSPIALRGVPVAGSEKKFTSWLMPKIFDMTDSDDTVNILFLDELSAAPQSVQAAAYQICLDRRIGEHTLSDNCIVIAAGNRTADGSVSYKMPKALCNRLMHFDVRPDFESWRKWAVRKGISEKVTAYLRFDSTRLYREPETSDLAYPTPRSWEFVSTLLNTTDAQPREIHSLIASCVGTDTATEFEAFCDGVLEMPSVEDIMDGRCKEYPKKHDVMYALISALVSTVRESADSISVIRLDNIFRYIMKLPSDFVTSYASDILEIEGISEKLMKCYDFQQWIVKRKAV